MIDATEATNGGIDEQLVGNQTADGSCIQLHLK